MTLGFARLGISVALCALMAAPVVAAEIEGRLLDTPSDNFGKIYQVSAEEVAPGKIQVLTFRKSSMFSSYSNYLFDCKARTFVALAGKQTKGNGLPADKALVLEQATDALSKPYEMAPLSKKGLDALTFEIARDTCNSTLAIDIAAE